jgi:hypothetical protein
MTHYGNPRSTVVIAKYSQAVGDVITVKAMIGGNIHRFSALWHRPTPGQPVPVSTAQASLIGNDRTWTRKPGYRQVPISR